MLKILELLRNEKLSVHRDLRLKSRQENFLQKEVVATS